MRRRHEAARRCRWRGRIAARAARASPRGRRRRARAPAPPPTAAARGDAGRGGQAEAEAAPRHLRLRHARHGLPVRPERPGLVRRACGRPSCPSFENEFGEDGHFYAGVRQSRLGVKGFIPTDVGRAQDHLRVRALRHRRRRRPDDVPPAPRLGRAGRSSAPARPGARSWTPTCSRTRSSTGARTGWCSSATSRSAGRRGRTATRASRSRSSGRARQRRPGRLRRTASSSQDVQGRFPLPDLSAHFR